MDSSPHTIRMYLLHDTRDPHAGREINRDLSKKGNRNGRARWSVTMASFGPSINWIKCFYDFRNALFVY